MFKNNLGPADRSLRVVAGHTLFAFSYWTLNPWTAVIANIMIITGMFGTCPLYSLLRLSTNRISQEVTA